MDRGDNRDFLKEGGTTSLLAFVSLKVTPLRARA